MSQAPGINGDMKTLTRARPRSRSPRRSRALRANLVAASVSAPVSPELAWSCLGSAYRVGVWPEPVFERSTRDGGWERYEPDPEGEEFAAAAVLLRERTWSDYLGFAPGEAADFVAMFRLRRLEAWAVVTRLPELMAELRDAPALVSFIAGHVTLRGAAGPRWDEIRAVYERGGRWALLDWLGLPATRKGWEALCALPGREVARKDLDRCRTWLWAVPGARLNHALAA